MCRPRLKKVSHFRAPRSDFARKDRRDWNISKFGIHFGMEKIGTGPCSDSAGAGASALGFLLPSPGFWVSFWSKVVKSTPLPQIRRPQSERKSYASAHSCACFAVQVPRVFGACECDTSAPQRRKQCLLQMLREPFTYQRAQTPDWRHVQWRWLCELCRRGWTRNLRT